MSWSSRLGRSVLLLTSLAGLGFSLDGDLWNEYGLVHTDTGKVRKLAYTDYRFKDLTGALAAWEWQRSPEGKPCSEAPFCTQDGSRTLVFHNNHLVVFQSAAPAKADVDKVLAELPDQKETALPAILTFIPRDGLVPDSAKYILGPASLAALAPDLKDSKPGFEQGAEAQIADYKLANGGPVHLALFYYPTPEMARQHAIRFKMQFGTHVKRSGVLLAVVYGGATDAQADTLLSRVQYEARITWNDTLPPSPVKPLYRLLINILWGSAAACVLGLTAGLFYAGARLYRRKYGNLESEEAMTTLHLR